MTNFNNNNNGYIPTKQFKLNIPQTATVTYFNEAEGNKDLTSQEIEQQQEVADLQNQLGEYEKAVGPCSYSKCPYDTPFGMEIFIEGNSRKGARKPGSGTFLPGEWEGNPTNSYLYREDLGLTDVDQARRVHPLLGEIDEIYAVNFGGKHCAEDAKFCNSARALIGKAIGHHEEGDGISEKITIDSNISKGSRGGFRLGAGIGATAAFGPVGAAAVGGATWLTGGLIHDVCDDRRARAIWNTISEMGGDAFKGGISLGIVDKVKGVFSPSTQQLYEVYDKIKSYGDPLSEIAIHEIHRKEGQSYNSNCSVCNS